MQDHAGSDDDDGLAGDRALPLQLRLRGGAGRRRLERVKLAELGDSGKLYAVGGFHTPKPGVYQDWGEAQAAGWNQTSSRKFEYNRNSKGGSKYTNPAECYRDALSFLVKKDVPEARKYLEREQKAVQTAASRNVATAWTPGLGTTTHEDPESDWVPSWRTDLLERTDLENDGADQSTESQQQSTAAVLAAEYHWCPSLTLDATRPNVRLAAIDTLAEDGYDLLVIDGDADDITDDRPRTVLCWLQFDAAAGRLLMGTTASTCTHCRVDGTEPTHDVSEYWTTLHDGSLLSFFGDTEAAGTLPSFLVTLGPEAERARRTAAADTVVRESVYEECFHRLVNSMLGEARVLDLARSMLDEARAAEATAAREAAVTACCALAAAGAVQAVLARYPKHDRPNGQRSAAAKQRRRAKQATKQAEKRRARQDAASSGAVAVTATVATTTAVAAAAAVATATATGGSGSATVASVAEATATAAEAALQAELDRERARRIAAEARAADRDKLLKKSNGRLKREVKTAGK